MQQTFEAIVDPSPELYQAVTRLKPENPFCTLAYSTAQASMGVMNWLFVLRDGGGIVDACVGHLRTGRLCRTIEIESAPSVSADSSFWPYLFAWCKERRLSELQLGSFASATSQFPKSPFLIRRQERIEWILELQSDFESRFSAKHCHSIRKARAAGLEVIRTSDASAAPIHVELMNASSERRRDRGENVSVRDRAERYCLLTNSGAGMYFQACRGAEVLSSAYVLLSRSGAYCYSAGTSIAGTTLGASHLVMAQIASMLRDDGYTVFNLGGAGPENPGLQRFKRRFGAIARSLDSRSFSFQSALERKVLMVARLAVVNSASLWRRMLKARRFAS
jgi:hypothetical protein